MDSTHYREAVKKQLEPNIYNHSLALEACMGKLYDHFVKQGTLSPTEPSREDWLLAGLVHDIDYSGEYKSNHPKGTKEVLAKHNLELTDAVDHIVKAHAPDLTGIQPASKADWTIFCADSLTGLIVAVALIMPSKKLADVKLSSVMKRFLKQPRFAAGTRRDDVAKCALPTGLNLPLETFVGLCLDAMKEIAPSIGL